MARDRLGWPLSDGPRRGARVHMQPPVARTASSRALPPRCRLADMERARRTLSGANGPSGGGSGFTGGMVSGSHPDRLAADRAERELTAAVNKSIREGEAARDRAVNRVLSRVRRSAGQRVRSGDSPTVAVEVAFAEIKLDPTIENGALESVVAQKETMIVEIDTEHRLRELRRDVRRRAKFQVSGGRKSR